MIQPCSCAFIFETAGEQAGKPECIPPRGARALTSIGNAFQYYPRSFHGFHAGRTEFRYKNTPPWAGCRDMRPINNLRNKFRILLVLLRILRNNNNTTLRPSQIEFSRRPTLLLKPPGTNIDRFILVDSGTKKSKESTTTVFRLPHLDDGWPQSQSSTRAARSGKLYKARSRLYRSRYLQLNIHLKALAEIKTIHSFAML